jgi:hypothetical protein
MTSLQLRQRDEVLLEALALRVRVLGQRQVAEAFWSGHDANARRRLQQLVGAGMLIRAIVPAQPLPELMQPIVRWQPGQAMPDVNQVAYQLQNRWRFRSLRPTVVYFPTEKTILQFGGRVRSQNKTTQITHDLGVTATWIRYFQRSNRMSSVWVGEEVLAPTRVNQKLPDAALVDQHGEPTLLIEFGGSYAAARVAAFHDDAAFRQIPYHLW